jgi:hypothetical protein
MIVARAALVRLQRAMQYIGRREGLFEMPRISLILIAGLGALLCGCASIGWHTYAEAPRGVQLAADGTKLALICRDQAPTGSKIVKRECHTQAEWDTLAEDNMQQFNQNAARSSPVTDMGSATGH